MYDILNLVFEKSNTIFILHLSSRICSFIGTVRRDCRIQMFGISQNFYYAI